MKPLSTRKLRNDLIGVAGVHYVAYRLSVRGLIVLPTIRNTAGIDLLVQDPESGMHASLQVTSSLKKVSFWPTSKPEKCPRGAGCYYVFLRWRPDRETFEAFLESADAVADQVAENARDYERRGKKEFSYWRLSPDRANELAQAWETWRPVGQPGGVMVR